MIDVINDEFSHSKANNTRPYQVVDTMSKALLGQKIFDS